MKKIIIGALIIALICITTGTCAVLSENVTNNMSNNEIGDVQVNTQDSEEIQTNQNIESESNIATHEVNNARNFDEKIYVGKYLYYNESQALDDRYTMCPECGGFHPIGAVTTPLPDGALCHYSLASFADNYRDYSYSYEEAYNIWIGLYNQQPRNGPEVHGEDIGAPPIAAMNTQQVPEIE